MGVRSAGRPDGRSGSKPVPCVANMSTQFLTEGFGKVNMDLAGWEIRPNVHHRSLYTFLECVAEIAHEFNGLLETTQQDSVTVQLPLLIAAARRISVSVRKILLDRSGALLKDCVVSTDIHPLVLPKNVGPAIFQRHYDATPVTLKSKHGEEHDVNVVVPAFDHITTIHPLYGISHVKGVTFQMHNPFGHSAEPVKFKRWMKTKILEVNGRQFTAEQILREMSNKEGAHIEYNPATILPNDSIPVKGDSVLHRECDWVRFNELSYLQIFSIYAGLYLANRTKPTLMGLPIPHDQAVQYMCRTINQCPQDMTVADVKLRVSNGLSLVFGDDNSLVDGYSTGITTTFKAPEKPSTR